MSDYEYDDGDYGQRESGGSLRAQLEQVLKENKALKEKTATLETTIAERDASEALTAKGYSPKVAKAAAAEGVDVKNTEALDKWLKDNSDWIAQPAAPQSQDSADAEDGAADGPDPEMVQGVESAYGAMNRIHSTASPAVANKYQAALASIPDDATPEQVLEIMRAQRL